MGACVDKHYLGLRLLCWPFIFYISILPLCILSICQEPPMVCSPSPHCTAVQAHSKQVEWTPKTDAIIPTCSFSELPVPLCLFFLFVIHGSCRLLWTLIQQKHLQQSHNYRLLFFHTRIQLYTTQLPGCCFRWAVDNIRGAIEGAGNLSLLYILPKSLLHSFLMLYFP